jgi:hypothetical protein
MGVMHGNTGRIKPAPEAELAREFIAKAAELICDKYMVSLCKASEICDDEFASVVPASSGLQARLVLPGNFTLEEFREFCVQLAEADHISERDCVTQLPNRQTSATRFWISHNRSHCLGLRYYALTL